MTGRSRTLLTTFVVLGGVWPLSARAYRPFNGTDAAVAERGDIEIELGPVGFVREGTDNFLVAPSAIFNWGFADRMELVLEGRHFVHLGTTTAAEPRFRVEETGLSLKTVLREGALQDKAGVSIAMEVGALLPTINGDPGIGAQDTLIVSQRWSDLTLHVNVAAAWTRAHTLGMFGGVIFEGHDAWAVRPVAEVFVEGQSDLPTVYSGLAGAIWRLREGLSFDGAFRLAREGSVDTTEIRVGLTWAFNVGAPSPRT